MLKRFLSWLFNKQPEPLVGESIYETLLNLMESIDDLANSTLILPKVSTVKVTVATINIGDLESLLIEASNVVSQGRSFSGKWRSDTALMQYSDKTLEQYITQKQQILHPIDWVLSVKFFIIKLLDAFLKLDQADSDYYQRNCEFLVNDIIELIRKTRTCLR